jgi:malate dehydrogenase (oxaloacetate-decarboxylating)(NADP+)
VLGLGDIGPLAGKPVMEGKGVLFKKFSGIDVFDIEINEKDPDKLVEIIAALEPTFGGINLEDIKAPDCFYVERKLRERMKIPVFHDDQHGTAIVVGAAMVNGLKVAGKDIEDRSSWWPPAPAPRRWPAWACWSSWGCRARTSGSPTSPAWSTRAAPS